MQVGDLVRCERHPEHRVGKNRLGVFLGYEGSRHPRFEGGPPPSHSYVLVEGKKLLFLTRELKKVTV